MRNHYVPEFYFKPWLNGAGHLFQFSRRRDRIVADKKTPGQICYVHDLHTLTGKVREETRHNVERWLTHTVDDRAAPVIKKILEGGFRFLDSAESGSLIRFVQALMIRRPESVQTLSDQTAPLLVENMSKLEEANLPDLTEALREAGLSVREWLDREHPGLVENAGQLMIGQLIANSSAGQKLFRLEWMGLDISGTAVSPMFASDRGVVALGKDLGSGPINAYHPIANASSSRSGKFKCLVQLGHRQRYRWED